jgi:CRP-like cAMP-binding protein
MDQALAAAGGYSVDGSARMRGMTNTGSPLNRDGAIDLPDCAAGTLDARSLQELAAFGQERVVEVGDVLYRPGDESVDFLVVLEGAVDVIRPDVEGESLITTLGAGVSSVS